MNQQRTCSRKLVTFYHYIHNLQVHKNVLFQTGHLTPLQLFECFFDNDVIEFVVNSTNKYAAVDCNTDFRTNYDEIRKMFGIMFVTGYHTLPTIRSYWSQNPTLGCPIIKSTMTRDRFLRLKRFLHVCDNQTIDPKEKFAKVSPLNNMLNKRFMQFGVFSHHLSIDEQMIAYYGRHSCKMFIKGKPIRFGYKYWCLCSSDGYLFQFIPYAGACEENDRTYGLGENVVLRLLTDVTPANQYTVTFDNFFTSHKLMCRLSALGYFATGTVRENRTGKAELTPVKEMKKNPRGASEFAFDENNEIIAVRWNDNAVVTVLSNYLKHEPFHGATRYSSKVKKRGQIQMPNTVHVYNKTMGGVDQFDNAMNNYRIRMRGKKWYWVLLTNAMDAAMVNAWKLHCLCRSFDKKPAIGQLEFRLEVAESLLHSTKQVVDTEVTPAEFANAKIKLSQAKQAVVEKKVAARTRRTPQSKKDVKAAETDLVRAQKTADVVSNSLRNDRVDHLVVQTGRRNRCRSCKSQTVFMCSKCNVYVHPKCFSAYHAQI